MGLYIKQATMPESCWTCELGMLQELSACPFYAFNTVEQDKYKEVRHPECPLIEVPEKHGKLVDVFEVKKDLIKRGFYPVFIKQALKDAPAIIEEEGITDEN